MSENIILNKVPSVPDSRSNDGASGEKGLNEVTEKSDTVSEKENDGAADIVYPTGFRILAIMIGLGLAVFCVSIGD